MSKEHWKSIELRDAAVEEWNKTVKKVIKDEGSFTSERDCDDLSEGYNQRKSRNYCIERRRTSYVGWWCDDHSTKTYAITPFQVLCDLGKIGRNPFSASPRASD